ncbi:MAG: Holliday junction resolvase RuvX [Muribaculaceae bacterium]|nr:Holliday junction resolvase RuvX [Bacteroides sp.]MDE6803850.1 Holliday junction resolvase RuvX [Muribaculaceae bacterium]MDE6842066.1 Holliday junction resolvase RuvX [Muribaculaceae bacterium]MDE7189437.1 Holliday junction resolvase RuvX [Muribaculaceae bacterium]
MGRIMAIDYGRKRCGVAVTDILQIAANGLPTVRTCDLMTFIKDYITREPVERIVIGLPTRMDGSESESMTYIRLFVARLHRELPDIPIEMSDERFTSTIAHREMLAGGFSRKQRAQKGRADEMAAVIILTDWLQARELRR